MELIDFIRSDIFYLLLDILVVFLFIYSTSVNLKATTLAGVFIFIVLACKLVIFIGLRPFDAGNDTITYYYTFQSLKGIDTAREVGGIYGGTEMSGEFLYWSFAAFLKILLNNSFGLFLISSILICGYLTYFGNKKLVDFDSHLDKRQRFITSVILTYLVFLSLEIAYFGGHIRSAFGIPIALISYYFAIKKNAVAAALLLFFATGFHNSAISILPLLLIEILTPNIRQSKKITLFILVYLAFLFFFGTLIGTESLMRIIGGYYADRYLAYVQYVGFNITSIFNTAYFWIILMYLAIFLLIGYKKVHFYAFYYMGLILAFSSTPKISERFFAYILIILPFLLYTSLRTRFNEKKSIFYSLLFFNLISPFVITSYAVISTLGIHSYLNPR